MTTLISAGVSVTIIDQSFYIPASAPTVPLFFIATRADKMQPDGITEALGANEHGVVRTMTSLNSSVTTYGIPFFRTDNTQAPLHGDARNEYGLFALNEFLSIANIAYVVRADIDLADADVVTHYADGTHGSVAPYKSAGAGSITGFGLVLNQATSVNEVWTLSTANGTLFTVTGTVSGAQGSLTVGVPYNNGLWSATLTGTSFDNTTVISFTVTSATVSNPLGANDAAKRAAIVVALNAQINGNMDVRSELYEYNLILCPGYYETVVNLVALNLSINDEAFVIADTPFTQSPEDTATWSISSNTRQHDANVGYYYPHALADNLDGVSIFGAASGVALKTFANSDNVSEVWYPPAGPRRGVVTGVTDMGYLTGTLGTATTFVSAPLNQGQRDLLYGTNHANVNPISFLAGRGFLVLGQKTSYGSDSALDRINVVRMLNMVKRDIRKASFAYLFEINDRISRESIKQMIDNYLHDILLRRGLYDFVTQCDEFNNTPTRIDRNELWVDIAVKPAKAIEFIYIPIRVLTTGA